MAIVQLVFVVFVVLQGSRGHILKRYSDVQGVGLAFYFEKGPIEVLLSNGAFLVRIDCFIGMVSSG